MSAAEIAANVAAVGARMAEAAARVGRRADDVTLVAATKTVRVAAIAEAVAAGVTDVGENRAQELLAKAPELATALGGAVRWHFLGAVQRNKVKALAPRVTLWHAVDRVEVGHEIARRAPGARVLVEVNLGGEPTKAGCAPEDAARLVDALRAEGLVVEGLMTVPPRAGEPRSWFVRLRELGESLDTVHLSMGMTDDFEVAVEEGATIVRIGRALFGARERAP